MYFLADLIGELEVRIDSEAFEVGPDCGSSILFAGILVKVQETFEGEKSIVVVIVPRKKIIDFVIVSLAHTREAG